MQDSRKDQRYVAGFSIIKELAKHLCSQLPQDEQKRLLKHAIKLSASPEAWTCSTSSLTLTDEQETALTLKVEQQLKARNKNDSIPRFNQLYRLLKHRGSSLLNNRQGLLTFLSRVSEGQSKDAVGEKPADTLGALSQEDVKNRIFRNETSSAFLGVNKPAASNVGGIQKSVSAEFVSKSRTKRPTSLIQNTSFLPEEKSTSSRSLKSRAMSTTALSALPSAHSSASNKKGFVSETRVVKELLFCFQGIPGTIFKQDHQKGFSVDPLVKIPHESLVLKLMELGYLNNRITNQCAQLEKGGAVAQAIHCGVKRLMNDFYAMIGCIHSEYLSSLEYVCDTPLSEDSSYSVASLGVGIFKLMVICREPLRTLRLLSDAIKFSLTGKGGAALSAIEVLRHHGDLRYSTIMHHIVAQAGKPLVHMIIEWMVHGTLSDPHDEFFITINSSCHERDIWRDKFILRSSLIPSVLTSAQADMILRAGKGIHFLNVIREVRLPLEGMRKKLHLMKGCSIIDFADPRSHVCDMLSGVVEETSKLVLDVLINEFKLFQHFQGLRRYILLGQGDFASYFLELIEPEMRKPASRLQYHELMSLLGTAVRGSTAAYDDPEILKRVTVKVLEASGRDEGSDVFVLQYLMHEPLDAAFKVSGGAYSYMFNFLWRTKRMEHVLLLLRKERWATKNELCWIGERVPEVNNVLMFADLMAQEFLHFARQFHYYILFEVVECLWEKFSQDFRKARSFDDVIRAHEEFIFEMQRRTFQRTENSRERYILFQTFINELRLIWDLVFELEALQHRFFGRILKEWDYRQERERALESGVGTTYHAEDEFKARTQEFKTFLASVKAQYNIIHRNYQDCLKKFLLDLTSQKDHELRLLSSRIDYNEFYKRLDARLNESMKFSRCSELFFL
uniref:Gamma-tubulin complex component 3 n=1 Tax=Lygus hesperus TaxID=30085 RepID=A0A146LLU2_LYGHE